MIQLTKNFQLIAGVVRCPAQCIAIGIGRPAATKTFIIHYRTKHGIGNRVHISKTIFYSNIFNPEFCLFPFIVKPIFFTGIIFKFYFVIIFYISAAVGKAECTMFIKPNNYTGCPWKSCSISTKSGGT